MDFLTFVCFLVLAGWLLGHARASRRRIGALEDEVRQLRRELRKPEESGTRGVGEKEIAEETESVASPPAQPEVPRGEEPASAPAVMPVFRPASDAAVEPEGPPESAKAEPPPLPERPVFRWRPVLEKLKLWPPSGEEQAEAVIGAWWLSRLGLIVLIIAAVFFGVRIAEDTPPWLRLGALAGIALGVALLGLWLERRLPAFGRLIGAGGLGLGYFTAFAAYGIEATKVIGHPAPGFAVQVLAVGVMVVWSLWKRDEAIGAMAVLLGLVACGFSHHHDLGHFALAGFLTLAAAGGAMLLLRGWIWPYAVGLVGSWLGFLVLGVDGWTDGRGPGYAPELGALVLLTLLLEAANFLHHERAGGSGRWHRRLALANTSLAIGVGWLALRLTYPPAVESGELAGFYLAFALLLGAFAALRWWRRHPRMLAESDFLKASALLALCFVAWFEGPTRWLSLAIQTVAVLGVWRRSRSIWIEIGGAVLFAAALGVIGHDTAETGGTLDGAWTMASVRHFAGLAALTILAAALAWHARVRRANGEAESALCVARGLAGATCGLVWVGLVTAPFSSHPGAGAVALVSIGALVLAAPVAFLRRSPVVVAGLAALVPAYVLDFQYDFPDAGAAAAGWTGGWLALLGFALAELMRRFWRREWLLGNGLRCLLHGLGLVALVVLITRVFALGVVTAGSLAAGFGLVLAGGAALVLQGRGFPEGHASRGGRTRPAAQWVVAVLAGLLTAVTGGWLWWADAGVWLVAAAGVLFATAFLARNATPTVAGGVPLVAGIATHLGSFEGSGPGREHVLSAGAIVLVVLATAYVLAKRVDGRRFPMVVCFDGLLHAAWLLVAHWLVRDVVEDSQALALQAGVALALVAAGRRLAFPALAAVSAWPLLLAAGDVEIDGWRAMGEGPRGWWWPAAGLIGAWLWAADRWWRNADTPGFSANVRRWWFAAFGGVAALGLSLAGRAALDAPWHVVSTAGFGVGLALLGRYGNLPGCRPWSLVPLVLAVIDGAWLTGGLATVSPGATLAAVLVLAALVAAHGVAVLAGLPKRVRAYAWGHGPVALGLAFAACAVDWLGVDSFTTVCWGGAAVALFVAGLAAGLRPYRLVGLIGLGLAMVRMFLVDIEDPLYRIYAFFGIAVVLLGMGALYHRFRHLIGRDDREG